MVTVKGKGQSSYSAPKIATVGIISGDSQLLQPLVLRDNSIQAWMYLFVGEITITQLVQDGSNVLFIVCLLLCSQQWTSNPGAKNLGSDILLTKLIIMSTDFLCGKHASFVFVSGITPTTLYPKPDIGSMG